MADQKQITLYPGDGTPKDIVLRELPVATVATTEVFLFPGDAAPKDIVLRTVPGAAEGASTNILAPSPGVLTLSGEVPAVSLGYAPQSGSLASTGHSPALSTAYTPQAGEVLLAGEVPTVTLVVVDGAVWDTSQGKAGNNIIRFERLKKPVEVPVEIAYNDHNILFILALLESENLL